MLFVATLTHSPDNCWGRPENETKAREWIASMDERADEADVGLHGAYATPNEHRFYFVLEADDFAAVTAFLGPPALQDHDADIAPVVSFEEAAATVLED
jgi:hypothetical protein